MQQFDTVTVQNGACVNLVLLGQIDAQACQQTLDLQSVEAENNWPYAAAMFGLMANRT